jgi:hypothetical protein
MGGVGWRSSGRPVEVGTEIFNERMCSIGPPHGRGGVEVIRQACRGRNRDIY